jgi:predicted small lipoprotein YifL
MSLGGCGNKGDLYLPEEGVETAKETDEAEQER